MPVHKYPPPVHVEMKCSIHDYNKEMAKATPMAAAGKESNAIVVPALTADSLAASETAAATPTEGLLGT
jgi:hypothetical protein